MLRAGICDDEKWMREELSLGLERVLHREEKDLWIREFANGEELLSYIKGHAGELDLLLLDIEMQGLGGMETARRLRKMGEQAVLIFVTGYRDYVFEGYQVEALDYLVKPVSHRKLKETLTRALSRLHLQEKDCYVIQNKEGLFRIPLEQIDYFYSDRRKVTAVTKSREYTFYGRLDETEKEAGRRFVRIHKRYLVRAGAVDGVEDDKVQLGEIRLPISRSCRQEAMLAFVRAMLGEDS